MTAMGTATAGAMVEADEDELGGGAEEVVAGWATMLDWEVMRVEEPPPDLVTTEVTTWTEVEEDTKVSLFADEEAEALAEALEGDTVRLAEGKEIEDAESEAIATVAAGSEKPVLPIGKKVGGAEFDEEVAADEEAEEVEEAEETEEDALPPDEETICLFSI